MVDYAQNETIVRKGQKVTDTDLEAIEEFGLTTARPDVARLGGWLVLSVLIAVFALVTWWLFFSPLSGPPLRTPRSPKLRLAVAGLVFASGAAFVVGTAWDELWHRMYGGFGDDFLWPPHLLMYASLGLNAAFAVGGLLVALRGRGGLRQRFRAEPLLGLLGLIAAYQMASIPSDLLWHQIIGPDITAWSLPHVLLIGTTSGTWLIGLAIARSTAGPIPTWRVLKGSLLDALSLGFVTLGTLMLLQLGVTEWEWISSAGQELELLNRPAWSYPVVVLLIGIATAHLALHATHRVGAATAVALTALAAHWVTLAVDRAALGAGPVMASHLLLVAPALAIDVWYATRRDPEALPARVVGSALYAAVFLLVGLPYAQQVVGVPGLAAGAIVASVAIGLVVAVLGGLMFADLGAWVTPRQRASA
jgi:hypothetical protein